MNYYNNEIEGQFTKKAGDVSPKSGYDTKENFWYLEAPRRDDGAPFFCHNAWRYRENVVTLHLI